jgi:hypothetical protein
MSIEVDQSFQVPMELEKLEFGNQKAGPENRSGD